MKKTGAIFVILLMVGGFASAAETITFEEDSTGTFAVFSVGDEGTPLTSAPMALLDGQGIDGSTAIYNWNGYLSSQFATQVEFTGAYFKSFDGSAAPAASLMVEGFDNLNQSLGVVQIELTNDYQFTYFGWENVYTVDFTPLDAQDSQPAYFLMDNLTLFGNDEFAPAVPAPSAIFLASGGVWLVGWLKRRKSF